eukprot:CAMPEP_0172933526 /NCGR_PEP_ID=MMETSP1075-20121228/220551_1 /TAXON_ID=2916 /ORGANISM="Ceratium fusus, Strain PA161109" /LENGTH=990 /DNA_ID=CAMNT_0013794869 /DNA_START=61 /DNA_END=3033 /DNA_ORIENTATION=+
MRYISHIGKIMVPKQRLVPPYGDVFLKNLLQALVAWYEGAQAGGQSAPLIACVEMEVNHQLPSCQGRLSRSFHGSLLEHMHAEGKFTDLVIIAEGDEIACHRAVLASASPVFDCMLSQKMIEGLGKFRLEFAFRAPDKLAGEIFRRARNAAFNLRNPADSSVQRFSRIGNTMVPPGENMTYEHLIQAVVAWYEGTQAGGQSAPLLVCVEMEVNHHLPSCQERLSGSFHGSLLERMHAEEKFTDLVIIAEGEEIACHRAVLASASPVFDCMLSQKMIEGLCARVELKDVPARCMRLFLQCIYTAMVPCRLDSDDIMQLLHLADIYDVPPMADKLGNLLLMYVSEVTVIRILEFLGRHRRTNVHIQSCFDEVMYEVRTRPELLHVVCMYPSGITERSPSKTDTCGQMDVESSSFNNGFPPDPGAKEVALSQGDPCITTISTAGVHCSTSCKRPMEIAPAPSNTIVDSPSEVPPEPMEDIAALDEEKQKLLEESFAELAGQESRTNVHIQSWFDEVKHEVRTRPELLHVVCTYPSGITEGSPPKADTCGQMYVESSSFNSGFPLYLGATEVALSQGGPCITTVSTAGVHCSMRCQRPMEIAPAPPNTIVDSPSKVPPEILEGIAAPDDEKQKVLEESFAELAGQENSDLGRHRRTNVHIQSCFDEVMHEVRTRPELLHVVCTYPSGITEGSPSKADTCGHMDVESSSFNSGFPSDLGATEVALSQGGPCITTVSTAGVHCSTRCQRPMENAPTPPNKIVDSPSEVSPEPVEDIAALDEEKQKVLEESFAELAGQENSDIAQALLHSKRDMPASGIPLSRDGVVILRLTRKARSPEVHEALCESLILSGCHQRVLDAGCSVSPEWALGARLLVPLTPDQLQESGVQLSDNLVVALAGDVENIKAALRQIKFKNRPKVSFTDTTEPLCDASKQLAIPERTDDPAQQSQSLQRACSSASWDEDGINIDDDDFVDVVVEQEYVPTDSSLGFPDQACS